MHELHFIDASTDLNNFLIGSYNYALIFLSVVVACLAAYAALGFSERMHTAKAKLEQGIWLTAGAGVLGLGIWSMHFIGMLAYQLPIQVTYDVGMTLISIIPAIFASFVVLFVIGRAKKSKLSIIFGAICMGAGIGTMHYSGMAAMQVSAEMLYDPLLFITSVLVAVALAGVSLYLTLLAEVNNHSGSAPIKLRASLYMGFAIAGMHYTGMSAANFVPIESAETLRSGMDPILLSALVVLVTGQILGLAIVVALVDKRLRDADYFRKLSETRYRSLYESMRDSAILFNIEHIIDCNTTALRMFGYDSKEELCTTHGPNLSPPTQPCGEKSTTLLRKHLSMAKAEGGQAIQWVHRRKDGSDFPAEVAFNAVQIEGENLFQAIVRDDTSRHEAEKELRASEELKSAMLSAALDCIITMDHEGRIVEFNPMAEKTFGYKHEDIVGQPLADKIIPPAMRKQHEKGLRHYLATGEGPVIGQRIEISAMHADGTEFPVELAVVPIDDQGKPFFTAYIRDITDSLKNRKDLEVANEEALRSAREAEEANQAKSIFLANMSHEIRTPMNAILGFTEILSGRIEDPQQKDYLDSIQTSAKVFLGLINDILDLSKVEAGTLEINYQPVDIHSISKDIRAIFEQKVTEKNIEFTVEVDPKVPQLLVLDEQHMRQIVVNLVGNAIKFTDEGSVKLLIEKSASSSATGFLDLAISVADTGVGIAESQLDAVFGVFAQQQGQNINKYGGTGLGLSISKRLVELMGGEITVHSEVDAGSIFRVTFKDIAIASSCNVETPEEELIDIEGLIFKPATILVADVISDNRKLINAYLEDYGFTILEAENGSEAIEKANRERPDLVLMDIKLPVYDGFQVTKMMKANDALKDIPIVVITAPTMKEAETEVREVCDGYLRKPVNKQQLISTIAGFLPNNAEELNDSKPQKQTLKNGITREALSDEVIAGLNDLVEIMDRELATMWPELLNSGNINRLEVFASRVGSLGDEYHYRPVSDWANRLKNNTSLFQIDLLPRTMEELPMIVNELKELTASELQGEPA